MRRVFPWKAVVVPVIVCAIVSQTPLHAQGDDQRPGGPSTASVDGDSGGGIKGVIVDSLRLVTIQHAWRTSFEAKTRRELGGPFLPDYMRSVRMPRQWADGDAWLTNNVGHPIQGAASGFIWLNNKGQAEDLVPGDQGYWKGRLTATAWATAFSLQFEFGPLSEASIGNVGMRPHEAGWTDHVLTPLGGLGLMVVEDSVDRFVITKLENRFKKPLVRNVLRSVLNPSRSMANIAGGKPPWHRSRPPSRRDVDRAMPQPSCDTTACESLAMIPTQNPG